MPGKVTIEFVDVDQAALVHEIMLAAFREYQDVLTVPVSAMWERVEDAVASIQRGGAVLAWLDGRAVGSARFELRGNHVYIGRVSVLPELRGRGIASGMMHVLEERATALGFSEIRIATRGSLTRNIALYEHLGYVVTGRNPHPRGDDENVEMAKRLI